MIVARHRINRGALLQRGCKLWLASIYRRLSGKRSIRHPYYAEITRDIPNEIFEVLRKLVRGMEGFVEPFCYYKNNAKAEVISITSIRLVKELFVLLSGLPGETVASYFKKNLTNGCRKGHLTSLVVSEVKDFAFVYKIKQGKLVITFNFGEWNVSGFHQH